MHSWMWALGFLLVGLIGWPSTRAQATSLAAAKWGLRSVLGATVLSGIGLCLAPDRVQELAPAVEIVGSGIGHLWHALPRGGQWLIVAVGLMLVGLPTIALLDFARDLTVLRGTGRRRIALREVLQPLAVPPTPATPYDVETALNAFRRTDHSAPPRNNVKRPLHDAL